MAEMKSLTLNDKTYDSFVDPVARAMGVINSASGENITLTDASNGGLVGLKIYGKTTQDGTPTPDAPVNLVSVGESGNITVNVAGENDSQSMTIETPNGLPGIPVESGGNYTDANGQQWICDEIDFARGVYVKRIERFSFAVADMDNSENYPGWNRSGIAQYYPNCNGYIVTFGAVSMSNITSDFRGGFHINTIGSNDILLVPDHGRITQSEWKTLYHDLVYELMISIPIPIETPLSDEELAAYASLHTYRDHTEVSNDAGAHMELECVVDTKKYIDSKLSSAILPARYE